MKILKENCYRVNQKNVRRSIRNGNETSYVFSRSETKCRGFKDFRVINAVVRNPNKEKSDVLKMLFDLEDLGISHDHKLKSEDTKVYKRR